MDKIKSAGAKIAAAWEWIDKKVSPISNKLNSKLEVFNSKVRRHKRPIIITTSIILVFMLVSALILASYRSVSFQDQGVVINYTQQYLYDQVVANDYIYIGLGSYFAMLPKQKILIKFQKTQSKSFQQNQQKYQIIKARTLEGTKINIQSVVQCLITTNGQSLKLFLEEYCFDNYNGQGQTRWMVYLNQKIKNTIIQAVSTYRFYQLSTSSLKQLINSQFSANYVSYGSPFLLQILSISINYPQNSFQLNNTLGLELLRQKSLLNQLNTRKNTLTNDILSLNSTITSVYLSKATSQANIDKRLLNVNVYQGWFPAFDTISKIFNSTSNSDLNKQKFTWLYFNTLYNATYRTQKMLAMADGYYMK